MLKKFPGFKTRNREEITNLLASKFNASRFNPKHFQTRTNWAELASSNLSVVSYRGDQTEVAYAAVPFVRCYVMIGCTGGHVFKVDGKTFYLDKKRPFVCMPANTSFILETYGDYVLFALRMNIDVLNAFSRQLLHAEMDEARFPLIQTNSQDQGAHFFGQRVRQLAYDLDLLGPQGPRTFSQSLESALLAQFILWTSEAVDQSPDENRANLSTPQFKRMEDYIRANWSRPISVSELTTEFNISARSIFRLFAQELHQTPLEYIKRVRLENARQRLLLANDEASVSGIAFECGFLSHGHFARDYHACFHELPSHTLKKNSGTI